METLFQKWDRQVNVIAEINVVGTIWEDQIYQYTNDLKTY